MLQKNDVRTSYLSREPLILNEQFLKDFKNNHYKNSILDKNEGMREKKGGKK